MITYKADRLKGTVRVYLDGKKVGEIRGVLREDKCFFQYVTKSGAQGQDYQTVALCKASLEKSYVV